MFKLDSEKVEELETKLPRTTGSYKRIENSKKISTFASLTMLKPLTVWIIVNDPHLQEMVIPDHLTCLLRNLYRGQRAIVRTRHRTMDWFQFGKGVCQSCIQSPCLSNLYVEYILQNAGLDEAQAIKIVRKNINKLRYADDTTPMAESEEKLRNLLMKVKVKEESEKAGLKLNIHKMKIMASSPITSWLIYGETMETMRDFIFWSSKILQMVIAAIKLKRHLFLGRKAMINLHSILKSRHYFADKGSSSQRYGFSSSHIWM